MEQFVINQLLGTDGLKTQRFVAEVEFSIRKQRVINHLNLLIPQQMRGKFQNELNISFRNNNCKSMGMVSSSVVDRTIMVFYKLIMKVLLSLLIVTAVLQLGCLAQAPFWNSIPSIRAGQIDSVTNLMTAEDTSTTLTDSTDTFAQIPGLSNVNDLQYGLSLISYQSWMTDTFSFNITLADLQLTLIKVRFTVLDNTFFTQAKVHYLLIWPNPAYGVGPLSLNSSAQINMEVIYGCYLTEMLLTNNNRNQTVGWKQYSGIATAGNKDRLKKWSMISGLKLSNSVGNNNHVKINPTLESLGNGSYYINYTVEAQRNNLLTFFCVSTVIADPIVIKSTYRINFEHKTYFLNATNTGLADVPYSARYDGADRMFFGISQFNLSMSDTRYLSVETANISLVSMLYAGNVALNQVTYHTLYFARQTCNGTNPIYDPTNYNCVAVPGNCVRSAVSTIAGSPLMTVCVPCHYSCLTCSIGDIINGCSDCPVNVHRIKTLPTCPCGQNYTDAGVQMCQRCTVTMPGCLSCNTPDVCTLCDVANNFKSALTSNNTCECISGYTLTTGFCLSYPGCLIAGYYNNLIACQICDASRNFTMETSNFSCKCLQGFFPTGNGSCFDNCTDNITAYGRCDDGNNVTGDGCDEYCNIQNGYVCPFNYTNISGVVQPGRSQCVLKQELTVSYLYAQRYIGTNAFKMAFQISPTQSGLKSTSFDKNFNTTLPIAAQKIYCDPVANIIYLEGVYLQDLEGSAQSFSISFNNMTFYADSQTVPFTATGINAQLVLDQYASSNTILGYIVMAEAFIALLVAIFASVVGLKLIGIELLIPLQLLYFSLSTVSQQRSYNFALNNFKYANGFNTLVPYLYARTYSQSKSLVAMNYETEFLLSTNVMLGIFVFVLIWLLIHHLRLKYKEYKLESFLEANSIAAPLPSYQKENSVDSEQQRENDDENVKLKKKKKSSADSQLQKQESKLREDHHRSFKVFSFQVDRVYFIFYLILINQMMFGFIIMTLNVPISTFYYPEEINVLACNFIFFIYIGNIVFISYDQQSNKMIAFTCIKDRYAYIYLLINFIIITALSMSFQESFSGYMMAALTLAFPLLVLKERPYGSVFLSLENVVALYLQVMLFICEVIICLIQASTDQKTSLVYSFLIMGLVAVGEVLTIIRLAVKVNFKKAFDDLKNPHQDEDVDKKNKKVIEKNLDLLEEDKNISIIPPESVKNDLIPKNKMVDWQSKNTEQYESVRQREFEDPNEEGNQLDHEDEASENKEVKLNELEILKKRLRNNLKLKKEQDMLKKGI